MCSECTDSDSGSKESERVVKRERGRRRERAEKRGRGRRGGEGRVGEGGGGVSGEWRWVGVGSVSLQGCKRFLEV